MASGGVRRVVRGLVEPEPGEPRRVPLGVGKGIRLEGDSWPSLDLWLGLFESELAPAVRELCVPGATSVDVGSYNGYYALVFARLTQAPVLAYDSDPTAQARIRGNFALNPDLARWVEFREAAVGATADPSARRVTLDEELAGCERLGLVKVDVEGAEQDVLLGARETLSARRPHLIVETHSPGLERACGDMLLAHGYRPRVLTARRRLPQNRPDEHNRWLVARGDPR